MVLPEIPQLLHWLCLRLVGIVRKLDHHPDPAGTVESLKEVIVSLAFGLLPTKVSLHGV